MFTEIVNMGREKRFSFFILLGMTLVNSLLGVQAQVVENGSSVLVVGNSFAGNTGGVHSWFRLAAQNSADPINQEERMKIGTNFWARQDWTGELPFAEDVNFATAWAGEKRATWLQKMFGIRSSWKNYSFTVR